MGLSGLITTNTNNGYDAELKTAAVEALRGEGGLRDICLEFKIRSKTQLRKEKNLRKSKGGDPERHTAREALPGRIRAS